jgi:hypothetical protein
MTNAHRRAATPIEHLGRMIDEKVASFEALPLMKRLAVYAAFCALSAAVIGQSRLPKPMADLGEAKTKLASVTAQNTAKRALAAAEAARKSAPAKAAAIKSEDVSRAARVEAAEKSFEERMAAFRKSPMTQTVLSGADGMRLVSELTERAGDVFEGVKADDMSGGWPQPTPLEGVYAHKIDIALSGPKESVEKAVVSMGAVRGIRPGSLLVMRDHEGGTVARLRWIVWTTDSVFGRAGGAR